MRLKCKYKSKSGISPDFMSLSQEKPSVIPGLDAYYQLTFIHLHFEVFLMEDGFLIYLKYFLSQ